MDICSKEPRESDEVIKQQQPVLELAEQSPQKQGRPYCNRQCPPDGQEVVWESDPGHFGRENSGGLQEEYDPARTISQQKQNGV